jgi:uncharacterized coiled-coil protein SlyX
MVIDLSTVLQLAGPLVTAVAVVSTLRGEIASMRLAVEALRADTKELGKNVGDAMKTGAVHETRIDALEAAVAEETKLRHQQRRDFEAIIQRLETRIEALSDRSGAHPRA